MSHIHNALHRFTAVQEAYQRALGEPGPEFSGIERGGETLQPIIDLWSQPDFALLRGEWLGWRSLNLAGGGAAFRSRIGVRNISTGANQWLVTVLPGSIVSLASSSVRMAITFTDGTDSSAFHIRDGRSRIAPPMVRLRADNADALPAGISAGEALRVDALTYELTQPVILRWGQSLFVYAGADNVAITATFFVKTRKLLPGEAESVGV